MCRERHRWWILGYWYWSPGIRLKFCKAQDNPARAMPRDVQDFLKRELGGVLAPAERSGFEAIALKLPENQFSRRFLRLAKRGWGGHENRNSHDSAKNTAL